MNLLDMINRMTMGRAILLGIILAVIYYFVILDSGNQQMANIASSTAAVNDLKKQIADTQAKLDRAAVYKKTAADLGSTINKLLGVIPEHFSINDLKKLVSNEVKIAGSSLASVTAGTSEISHVAKEFEELTVNVDVSGSFLQHMVFLSNLTKISQILIVRKFELTTTHEAKGEEAPTVHMVTEIVAYRYRGGGVVPPAGTPGSPPPPAGGEAK